MNGRTLLTLAEAAEMLGISRRTLERRVAAGALPVFRDGPRLLRIARSDLDAYVQGRTILISDLVAPARVPHLLPRAVQRGSEGRLWDAPDPLTDRRAA